MAQGYMFPPIKITPKTLQKAADKLQPLENRRYLFQGNERQQSKTDFLLLGGVGGLIASAMLVVTVVCIRAIVTKLLPLLAREVAFIGILQELWLPLLGILAFMVMIILLLRMIFVSWHEHKNKSKVENTNLLISDQSFKLGDTVQLALRRKVNNPTYWQDTIRVYVRVRCLEITKNDLGTEITYEHTPLWESKGQHHRVEPLARAITANFSFSLPRADKLDPITYQSPELIKSKDATTHIAWVIELWQISKELKHGHFVVPITVQA